MRSFNWGFFLGLSLLSRPSALLLLNPKEEEESFDCPVVSSITISLPPPLWSLKVLLLLLERLEKERGRFEEEEARIVEKEKGFGLGLEMKRGTERVGLKGGEKRRRKFGETYRIFLNTKMLDEASALPACL